VYNEEKTQSTEKDPEIIQMMEQARPQKLFKVEGNMSKLI
jgi:hypothetical protein